MRQRRMEMKQFSFEEELANLQFVSHSNQISFENNVTHHEFPSNNRNSQESQSSFSPCSQKKMMDQQSVERRNQIFASAFAPVYPWKVMPMTSNLKVNPSEWSWTIHQLTYHRISQKRPFDVGYPRHPQWSRKWKKRSDIILETLRV